ncbi:alpha-amylase family glycosyl hydrolase [Marilutibacter alkalisoli]|nr:alpha-amylase family glycosyl hydrolase [Lysobacter alkalisoli]
MLRWALLSGCVGAAATASAGDLHVPSPDWRDQVVYFAMIDRFDDGDPSNNDQGVGEYDPADNSRYSGGDLRGLTRRLDYIQGLGATALWITPPVANQWLNPDRSYGGYHGYWASDLSAIDAHYGTLDDYRALSRALHGRGMYLIQDVVVNHTGDWIGCGDAVDPDDNASIAEHCRLRGDAQGRSAPVQPPFDRNDPQDPADREAAIYHFTPPIADYSNRRQELDYALADLDDLNTENPVVRRALRKAYGDWIREAGVDAFRIDTAFHVPAEFFNDFLHADDPEAPGMTRVAAETGRADFLSFGEGFGSDKPFGDAQARKLDAYMRTPGGLPSMINFPLYGTLGDVFARGRPAAELRHRVESMMTLHADPWRMPSFIDNHDVDRFLASSSEAGLKQALLAMLTLPGIPVVYSGTEQGFREQRRAMFASGFGSGGRDHFDTEAPLYRYLRDAIALRRGNAVLSRGTPVVLAANPARAGAIAWRTDGKEETALVILNSAGHEVLLDDLDTGLPAGTRLQGLFAIDAAPRDLVVGEAGRLTLVLPPHSGEVWRVADTGVRSGRKPSSRRALSPPRRRDAMDAEPLLQGGAMDARLRGHDGDGVAVVGSDFEAHGTAPGTESIRLVIDGDLGNAQTIAIDEAGHWQARLRADDMIDPAIEHRVVAYDPGSGRTSPAQLFRVALDWRLAADITDPQDDDTGPTGTYTYPTGPGWREHRPADIERLRVWTAGAALRFELTMRSLSTAWHPASGFDHVAITAFLQLPEADGARVMPQQHAELPDGMRWHRRLRAHGWSNALFSHEGASADVEGTPVTPVADIAVDHDARTIAFTLPAGALGHPTTLAGARLHVTTWDYDGGYRPLAPEAGATTFGGGEADGARVMDEVSAALK